MNKDTIDAILVGSEVLRSVLALLDDLRSGGDATPATLAKLRRISAAAVDDATDHSDAGKARR